MKKSTIIILTLLIALTGLSIYIYKKMGIIPFFAFIYFHFWNDDSYFIYIGTINIHFILFFILACSANHQLVETLRRLNVTRRYEKRSNNLVSNPALMEQKEL